MSIPAAWVAGLLAALEPSAPWSGTYDKTAEAIARAAESDPLYAVEEQGEARTAALLVALAWYESRFKPNAVSRNKHAYCLYQVDRSYFPEPDKALADQDLCTRTALKVLRVSLEQCKGRAPSDRLAFYMSGQCDRGGADSRYRMYLAKRLLKEHPVPVTVITHPAAAADVAAR